MLLILLLNAVVFGSNLKPCGDFSGYISEFNLFSNKSYQSLLTNYFDLVAEMDYVPLT